MSPIILAILIVLAGAIWLHLRRIAALKSPYNHHKLPPSPSGLPIIGHLHLLGKLPTRSLHKLSQQYGPIMSIRLGSVPTIIVSSPEAAALFLKTHDTVFANRPNAQAPEILSYGNKGIGFTKYGSYWRNVRKFCTLELLSVKKIDSMAGLRRVELELVVESLKKNAVAREVVDVTEKVARLIQYMACRMLFGKSRAESFELTEVINEMGQIVGAFNIADYVPFLGPFDLQGMMRQFKTAKKSADKILETIIDDHEKDAKNTQKKLDKDFVDILLSLKDNLSTTHEQLSNVVDRSHIKAILLDIIFAGIYTSQTLIEWTMSELIRDPRVMKLVQDEIRTVMGDSQFVEESHLPKLSYLDIVVKESLRLHPVTPFLLPHESIEDIVIDGYYIPKGSRILVSAWAIGRDPEIWSKNVEEFFPERFIDRNIDFRGKNVFEFIPFGWGRRGCPGMHLGLTVVKLVVAQLVHSFNWELPFAMSPNELDMDETFGLTLSRANHLLAIPCLRV